MPTRTVDGACSGLVVGVGLRSSTGVDDLLAAIDDARAAAGVPGEPVTLLASWTECADREALAALAARLGCSTSLVETDVLRRQPVSKPSRRVGRLTAGAARPAGAADTTSGAVDVTTRSVTSVAEASARAAVGPHGRVLLARHVGRGCVVSLARAAAEKASAAGAPGRFRDVGTVTSTGVVPAPSAEPDLDHHGDAEASPGLLDFAVNVAVPRPPEWLAEVLRDAVAGLAAYPDDAAATRALAASLGVETESVLLLNGAAEGFTLLARAGAWTHPLVVHPQFTEPEAALRDAGHRVHRHVLDARRHFVLRPDEIDPRSDLVVLGNPTNPTSRLHARSDVLALLAPDRLVVVDEAFMDVVAGEPASVLPDAPARPGLLVLRSLTKTFGIAGLRAGYAVGHPDEIARLRRVQQPWSVNALSLAAVRACTEPGTTTAARAARHAAEVARVVERDRPGLVATLERHGLSVVSDPAGPFVLARHPRATDLRRRLREQGVACRRGDTFPGLGGDWLRFAVRDAGTVARLDAALADCAAAESPEAAQEPGRTTDQEAS